MSLPGTGAHAPLAVDPPAVSAATGVRTGRVAVLGESPRIDAWALAGALVVPAADADGCRRAWAALPDDVDLVVLTPAAAAALRASVAPAWRLRVVMPS